MSGAVMTKNEYKQTEIGLIPVDWDLKTFKDISKVNQGLQIAISSRHKNAGDNRLVYLTIQYLNTLENAEYVENAPKNVICSKDDVLMTRTGNTGVVITNVDGVFHNNFFKINFDRKLIDKDFLVYFLSSPFMKKLILIRAGLTTIPDLNHNDFYSLPVVIPSIKEQQAIAEVLSDMDELIEKTQALIDKKRNIKTGAMHDLLTPKEGWFVKPLGEIAQIKTGQRNNEDKIEEGIYPFFVRSQHIEKINTYSFDGEAILIPGEGGIGSIFHYINGRFDYHQRVYKISNFNENYCGKFIYFCMFQNFGKHAMKNSVKATVDSLRLPTFQEFEILFPKTKEDQQTIAEILSDMDTEIEQLEQQLEKYKSLQIGMMQELLTGKTRLV